MATGSGMFSFLAWFFSLPWTGKTLVDGGGLTLQTQWCAKAAKREKFNFQLLSMAQKYLCLSSLLSNMLGVKGAVHLSTLLIDEVFLIDHPGDDIK